MLTVRKIGSVQAADYSAYLVGRADDEQHAWRERGDYYTGEHAAGEWAGDEPALSQLGVQGGERVERDQLAQALRGRTVDGAPLRVAGANGVVNSHDLTFGCPKSVSVLWAQSSAEQRILIETAARDAADHAVRYMATTTPCVQRRVGRRERVWEPARGVAHAQFVHHTARSTRDGSIPDPHLHVHCVVVAVERSDGRIVTPNQAAWMRHGREGGAYFRAELADRLMELGLEVQPETGKGGRFFELAGVPVSVCEQLSGRSREVEVQRARFVREYGRQPRERELADLAIKSRERKVSHTAAELEPYWDAVCAEHGFDRAAAHGLWTRERELDPAHARAVVAERLPEVVAERGATLRTREVRAAAYELSAGRLTTGEAMRVVEELQQLGVLIALADDRVTTVDIRARELQVLRLARTLEQQPGLGASDTSTSAGIAAAESALGRPLSTEQADAARVLCGDARVAALVGPAGSGKGSVIRAASETYRADGWQVLCVATQGATAQRLGGQAAAPAYTIDGLLARTRYERIALDGRSVVLVDEAAMVDTHRMAALLELSAQSGCSLRLVGDAEQLASIGPGGMFGRVCDHAAVAELGEVHRAREPWLVDAQLAVRDARSEDALAILREHDAAHMLDTRAEAMQRMVDDWDQWRQDHDIADTLLVVHTSNDDVDRVNELCQAKRHDAGELGPGAVPAPDRDYDLHPGDRVMFRERPYEFDDPAQARVENGTRGVIDSVDPTTGSIRVAIDEADGSRLIEVDLDRCAALRLDYANHVYPAQGDTRSQTAELTGGLGTSKEAAYVGGSRHRDRHDLYTSREALGTDGTDEERWARLAEQMNTSQRQQPSIDYTAEQRRIATDLPPTELERAHARLEDAERRLADATAARDALDRTRPRGVENELRLLERKRDDARRYEHDAQARLQRIDRQLEKLPFWKRDERARLERDADHAADSYARNRREHQQARRRIDELRAGPNNPEAWHRHNAAELERRTRRVEEITRERDALRDQAVERAIERPPRYLTRALGPRPHHPGERSAWEGAAREAERYRHEYRVRDRVTALGRAPSNRARGERAFVRELAHSAAERAIGSARQILSPTRIAKSYLSAVMTLARFVERDEPHHRQRRSHERGIDLDWP